MTTTLQTPAAAAPQFDAAVPAGADPAAPAPWKSRAIGAAFAFFSSLRVVAYLPMLWVIATSGDGSQHSLLTWGIWFGSNISTALWLRERGSGVRGAVLVSLSNGVMCGAAILLILALRT